MPTVKLPRWALQSLSDGPSARLIPSKMGSVGWIGRLIGRNFELSMPPDDFTRLTR